jgi:prevent-host-death family protein
MRQFTSREFNQDISAAKRAADEGPVTITDRGKEAYVLLNYAEYRKLTKPRGSLADALAQDDCEDFEFDPPKLGELFPNGPDFP